MAKLRYNEDYDQMELEEESGSFETQFMVPPYMKDGDNLTPFQFQVLPRRLKFYIFGRYNEGKDLAEFVVAGPSGYRYKISFADGNSPYGWKIKKHGLTRSNSVNLDVTDKMIGFCLDRFLVMVGKDPAPDYQRDIVQADAFSMEEIIGVPMAMMRLSHRNGVLDAREKCIGPWSFYGPSLPEAFCRCRLKVVIYPTKVQSLVFNNGEVERPGTSLMTNRLFSSPEEQEQDQKTFRKGNATLATEEHCHCCLEDLSTCRTKEFIQQND